MEFNPLTALSPIMIITYAICKGRPKKFVMINKQNKAMKLGERSEPAEARTTA